MRNASATPVALSAAPPSINAISRASRSAGRASSDGKSSEWSPWYSQRERPVGRAVRRDNSCSLRLDVEPRSIRVSQLHKEDRQRLLAAAIAVVRVVAVDEARVGSFGTSRGQYRDNAFGTEAVRHRAGRGNHARAAVRERCDVYRGSA